MQIFYIDKYTYTTKSKSARFQTDRFHFSCQSRNNEYNAIIFHCHRFNELNQLQERVKNSQSNFGTAKMYNSYICEMSIF